MCNYKVGRCGVLVGSIIVGLLGLVTIIVAFATMAGFTADSDSTEYKAVAQNLKEGDTSDFDFDQLYEGFAGMFLLFCIVTGALGLCCPITWCVCLKWCKKPGAISIGVCSFLLLIIALIVTVIVGGIAFASSTGAIDMYCGPNANNADDQRNEQLAMYFERINEVDSIVNPKINDYMCQIQDSACYCSQTIRDNAQKWSDVGVDITTNSYYYSSSSDFVSFIQVYNCAVEKGYLTDSSDTTEYGLKTIKFLETQFGCSGFCNSPNFYVYLDNAEYGPPTNTCVESIANAWSTNFTGLAAIFIITTIGLFITFTFTPCICCCSKDD